MRNALVSLVLAVALTSFFSFTNRSNRVISLADSDDDDDFVPDSIISDTSVPVKKNHGKEKSKTVPYDSFGKPKKMDSTHR
jgi:hypothetical protein